MTEELNNRKKAQKMKFHGKFLKAQDKTPG